jgi:hypothetical protein
MQLAVALCSFPGRVLGSEVRPRKYRYAFAKTKSINYRSLKRLVLLAHKANLFHSLFTSTTAVTTFFQSLMKLPNGVKLLVDSVLLLGTRAALSSLITPGSACGIHTSTGNAGAKSVWDLTTALFNF